MKLVEGLLPRAHKWVWGCDVVKLTPKQEKFCQLYIELGNASEAYRQAYDCKKMKPESIHVNAAQLLESTKVALRMGELQAAHRQRHNLEVDDLLEELEEARKAALTAETPQSSAAVAATMGKAKLLGLGKEVVENKTTVEVKSGLGWFYGESDA